MSRLIDADALRKELFSSLKLILFDGSRFGANDYLIKRESVVGLIIEAPTIDAEPVRHGRWKRCFEDWRKQLEGDECSACGFQYYGMAIDHYLYCPNCGAKMDAKEEDHVQTD